MPIVNAITPRLTLINWIKPFFVHPSISANIPDEAVQPYVDPSAIIFRLFFEGLWA